MENNNTNTTNKPPKVWVDSFRIKSRDTSFGTVLALGVNVDKAIEFLKANKNEAGYCNIDITPRKEIGTYGESHSASLNTWKKPENSSQPAAKATAKPVAKKAAASVEEDDNSGF